ncbi:MAG: DUF3616 domain-containing protein [Propionivibrio sp.]|uniref:DUF3616 domain-containing protein n=1 Tax=Propionivibrio sp. TaxID=2212460 RepID=UPI001A5E344D|nr:DUF3616 domain-containing protein [Propionivibrio sp.]MBL8414483.1 DUF3616 domain-containing protein [Propionivibrio sp.]
MTVVIRAVLALLFTAGLSAQAGEQPVSTYSGPCDASAAVALDAGHFVVGDDEHNTLYIYRRGQAQAIAALNLSKFLDTGAEQESDIEGAAAVGQRIYWITSHGRDGKGRARPARHRFFATEVLPGNPPALKPLGEPYTRLLHDMEESAVLRPYRLGDAARLAAEADGGFNIEGLAATPAGTLLIGLRNPLSQQRALLIPLENPGEVISGRRARFGTPIELDLGRRGIRSIERFGESYLIAAGPTADSGSFALFRWSGRPGDAASPLTGIDLGELRPEALFAIPHTGQVQLLSDDGGVTIDGVKCKKLPAARQTFRSLIVTP